MKVYRTFLRNIYQMTYGTSIRSAPGAPRWRRAPAPPWRQLKSEGDRRSRPQEPKGGRLALQWWMVVNGMRVVMPDAGLSAREILVSVVCCSLARAWQSLRLTKNAHLVGMHFCR